MTASTSVRLLYLGRSRQLARQIDTALQEELARNHNPTRNLQFTHVTSQKQALNAVRAHPPHGLLLEVDHSRYRRHRFCTELRNRYPQLIIVAVCKGPPDSDAFRFDGHVERPFAPEQARAALNSLLHSGDEMQLRVGPLRLDVATRVVEGPRGCHRLPPKLCSLLRLLMQNPGKTVSREEIMLTVWETQFLGDTRTLDVHVRWLRERIEPDPSTPTYLQTVRGVGYCLAVPEAG